MFKQIGFPLMAALALGTHAAPLDVAKSQVKFVFTQMNVPVEGSFKKLTGDIHFDAAKPEASKANVSIELSLADAGGPEANDMLKSSDWFNTPKFPQATFTSNAFKSLGGGKVQVQGQLSLKGKTALVSIPFTARVEGAGQWLEGAFPLSRLAWKVGENEWSDVGTVADTVQVKFKLFVPK